jgi:hypothetical protein
MNKKNSESKNNQTNGEILLYQGEKQGCLIKMETTIFGRS